jgi:hypothetical protein
VSDFMTLRIFLLLVFLVSSVRPAFSLGCTNNPPEYFHDGDYLYGARETGNFSWSDAINDCALNGMQVASYRTGVVQGAFEAIAFNHSYFLFIGLIYNGTAVQWYNSTVTYPPVNNPIASLPVVAFDAFSGGGVYKRISNSTYYSGTAVACEMYSKLLLSPSLKLKLV